LFDKTFAPLIQDEAWAARAAAAAPPPVVAEDEVEKALFGITKGIVNEDAYSRRGDVTRCFRARAYAKGDTGASATNFQAPLGGVLPSGQLTNVNLKRNAPTAYNIPMVQAYKFYVTSVLGGADPTVRWYPVDVEEARDVESAKARNQIMELFYRNNDIEMRRGEMVDNYFSDGFFGAYIRYRVDAKRFGTTKKPIIQEAIDPLSGAVIPQIVGVEEIPNGGEVMEIYGKMDLRLPPQCKTQSEFPYLQLATYHDVCDIKALYPEHEDKIVASDASIFDTDPEEKAQKDILRRNAIGMSWLAAAGATNIVQLTRTWIRPHLFYRLSKTDPVRKTLAERYPTGVCVISVNEVVLDLVGESMDDVWVISHAYPGDSQIRPAIGDCLLDIQDAVNDGYSLFIHNMRHSMPKIFVSASVMAAKDVEHSQPFPGDMIPVMGEDPGRGIFESRGPSMPNQSFDLLQNLTMGLPQFLAGSQPAMMGAATPSQRTASGYEMMRDQSLGRVGIPWRSLKSAYVEIAKLVVELYKQHRPDEDVSVPSRDGAGWRNNIISKAALEGNAWVAPESDEQYPISPSEQRETVMQAMMNNTFAPPTGGPGAAQDPINFPYVKSLLGLKLILPGETAREKQSREIDELIAGKPRLIGYVPDPMTGQMVPQWTSSVPVNPLEDHANHMATISAWIETPAAQKLQRENPSAVQNVVLHYMEHQMAMAPPPMPGPPGAPPMPGGGPMGMPPPSPEMIPAELGAGGQPGAAPPPGSGMPQEIAQPPIPGGF